MSRRKSNFPPKKLENDSQSDAEKYDEVLNSLNSIQAKRKEDSLSTPSTIKPSTMVMGVVLIVIIGVVLLSFGTLPSPISTGPIEADTTILEGIDFKIHLLDSTEVMLSDYIGKPILLDFFATYCGPCLTQISYLQSVQSQYPNVHILSVSVWVEDSLADLTDYKSEHGMTWVVGHDSSQQGALLYGVSSVPTMAFFDDQGTLKHLEIGVTTDTTLISWINGG